MGGHDKPQGSSTAHAMQEDKKCCMHAVFPYLLRVHDILGHVMLHHIHLVSFQPTRQVHHNMPHTLTSRGCTTTHQLVIQRSLSSFDLHLEPLQYCYCHCTQHPIKFQNVFLTTQLL